MDNPALVDNPSEHLFEHAHDTPCWFIEGKVAWFGFAERGCGLFALVVECRVWVVGFRGWFSHATSTTAGSFLARCPSGVVRATALDNEGDLSGLSIGAVNTPGCVKLVDG
ncbi:hypothetical protein EV193_104189 [Herbihabitans rhizosphaerae]|uniref:Uncharacterized protein n=1 Tax=Herbihabitans rhizosphaerae TaxID=1872711 RepID=A0A4Q7KQ81_9PSEU|nr:hypothetical protein [Herbihabitans rhizosphaerae]RZS38978.1 hypothetical protein EV193_104189 [Herbihabitans rhizosphaerae]